MVEPSASSVSVRKVGLEYLLDECMTTYYVYKMRALNGNQIVSVGPMNGEDRGSDTKPVRPLT